MIAVRVGVKDGVDREALCRASSSTSISDPHMRFWGPMTVAEVEQEIERRGFREVVRRGDTVLYRKERGT